jgi:hypothetical protein
VYDIDLVKRLCSEITAEKDAQESEKLMALLEAVIKDNQKEVRSGLSLLAKKYASILSQRRIEE